MTKIKTLETILYRFPLPEPVEAAAAGVISSVFRIGNGTTP